MSFVRMKPPVGVTVGLGANDVTYYVDQQGFANVDSGSVTKLTSEGWVRSDYVAPPSSPAYQPVMAGVDPLTGGITKYAGGVMIETTVTAAEYAALVAAGTVVAGCIYNVTA